MEGEVRPMNHDDDMRSVVWTLSARGEQLMVRMRATERSMTGLMLDLRAEPGAGFERSVSELASLIYAAPAADAESVTLTLVGPGGRRTIHGRSRVLDLLATVQPMGTEAA
jgi:uncharacterized protein (DUF58 family)